MFKITEYWLVLGQYVLTYFTPFSESQTVTVVPRRYRFKNNKFVKDKVRWNEGVEGVQID